ncbi:MAG: NgoFVII family restriction endonuclease [Bacillota bacterium]|nr:NgoFVII family restriction endonuclease [Bacillota bacterium]
MTEQIDIFSLGNEQTIPVSNSEIEVEELSYVSSKFMSWEELFSGYEDIKVITFSSGINFTYKLLDMFETAEVIFGCENVLSGAEKNIIAYQTMLIQELQKNESKLHNRILNRIDDGTAHFYISRTKLSHEKLYLLSSKNGNKRVVGGSANMSFNAFSGKQRERIYFIDGEDAYEHYLNVFEELKKDSTDEIANEVLLVEDINNNPDKLPIARTVSKEKIVYVERTESKDVRFILETKNLADNIEPMLPKTKKPGKLINLTAETFNIVKRKMIEDNLRKSELRSEYPELIVNIENKEVELNGKKYNLNPNDEDVTNDVNLFMEYMNGYRDFHGDSVGMQYRYFEFANWFFVSPFMAQLRDMAASNDINLLPYPVFGLLYGQSKAGKTTFLETLLKMMIGQKPKMSAPDFTRKDIDRLKRAVKGSPIIVDDMTQVRFTQHAIETIKNDMFGVSEHLKNYPAIVISANEDVKAVAPEIVRRTIICRVEAGLTNTEVMKSSLVKKVQKNIGTAFYEKYLAEMIPVVEECLEQMKDETLESPDILKESSIVIKRIIESYYKKPLPDYIRELSLADYFSEKVTGKYAIKTIQNAWRTSRKQFEIDKRKNELRYNAGQSYDAERIKKELPENLEIRKSREWLIMNLEEAKKYFEIEFKKSILDLFTK